jgi:hypothetical protein
MTRATLRDEPTRVEIETPCSGIRLTLAMHGGAAQRSPAPALPRAANCAAGAWATATLGHRHDYGVSL